MFECIKGNGSTFKNLVNGVWIEGNNDNLIDIKSPIDGKLLGRVFAMNKEDIDEAIECANIAQKKWKDVPLNERVDVLYKASKILIENEQEISTSIMREVCKDMKSCKSEVERTAEFISFTADCAKSLSSEIPQSDSFPGTKKNKICIVEREPLGVVLAISPFNYPINLSASKIAPAIVMGNSVIFKPATQASISGLYLAKVFEEAGVPKGVLNTVTGRGSDIGDYIITHEGIKFINFTGSTKIGKRIAEKSSMIPLLLELGGKDAAIVLENADLEIAAANIVSGAFSYSGQRCTAVKRVLAVEEIADSLIKKIKQRVEELTIGNPLENDSVDIVPLISEKSADFVENLIEDAEAKGAKLVTEKRREGNLIYPCLLDNVTLDMKVAWEEPFGPVLPIIRVKDKDEAIIIANKSRYGLQSSVFTKDINDAMYVSRKLETGTVHINNKNERGPDNFPFLGVKGSGLGVQGIKYSLEAMTRPKVTILNFK